MEVKYELTKPQAERLMAFIVSNALTKRDGIIDVLGAIRVLGMRDISWLLDCRTGNREEVAEGPYFFNEHDDNNVVFNWTGVCTLGRYVKITYITPEKYEANICYGRRNMTANEAQTGCPEGWTVVEITDDGYTIIERNESELIDGALYFTSTGKVKIPIGLGKEEVAQSVKPINKEMVSNRRPTEVSDDDFVEVNV